jgi:hypothetical protein
MNNRIFAFLAGTSLVLLALLFSFAGKSALAQTEESGKTESIYLVTGTVFDRQNIPVRNAVVTLFNVTRNEPIAEDITQPDGRYAMNPEFPIPAHLYIRIGRPHFQDAEVELGEEAIRTLQTGQPIQVPEVVLARRITPAFWIATFVLSESWCQLPPVPFTTRLQRCSEWPSSWASVTLASLLVTVCLSSSSRKP